MKFELLLVCLLFSFNLKADPEKLDVIFLSHSYSYLFDGLLKPKLPFMKKTLALSLDEAKKSCFPMGDGCFHPQYGIISDDMDTKPILPEQKEFKLKTINAMESDLVDCREGEYFDIFCGKASKVAKRAPIEVWVDVSASMRHSDSDASSSVCYRRTFINNILDQCPKDSVDVAIYNNTIKQMGSTDTLCMSYGMNSPRRFKDWINASTAKHLFVITDIDEMTMELSEFLQKKGASVTGIGAKDFSAKNLTDYAKDFIKTCQKVKL